MKFNKKLGLVIIFVVLALVSVESVAALELNLSWLGDIFDINVIVNAVVIGAAFYFALPLIGQKIESKQAITAALILIGVVSFALAVNLGTEQFIWEKPTFVMVRDYLFGAEDSEGRAGILTVGRIGIFIGAAALFQWFFTFLKVGAEKAKINTVLALVIGANLARSGMGVEQLVRVGEVIAIFIIYHNLQATVKNKIWAFVMSFLLVEYIAGALGYKGIVIGGVNSMIAGIGGLGAAKWPLLIAGLAMLTLGGGAIGVGALVNWGKKGKDGSLRKSFGTGFGFWVGYWIKQAFKRIPGLKRANWKDPIKEGETPRAVSDSMMDIERQKRYIGRFGTFNEYWKIVLDSEKKVSELLGQIPAQYHDYYKLKEEKNKFELGGTDITEIYIQDPQVEGDNVNIGHSRVMVRKSDGTEVELRDAGFFGWLKYADLIKDLSAKLQALHDFKNDKREQVKKFILLTGYDDIRSEEEYETIKREDPERYERNYHSRQNTSNTFWTSEIQLLTENINALQKQQEALKKRHEELEGYDKTWGQIIKLMSDVYATASPGGFSKYTHSYIIKAPPEGGEYEMENVEIEREDGSTVTIQVPKAEELPWYQGFEFNVAKLEKIRYRMLPPSVFYMLVNRHWDNLHDDLKDGRWHPYSRTLADYQLAMHRRINNDDDIKNWYGPPTHENFSYDKKATGWVHFGSLNYYDHTPVYGKRKELRLNDNDPITGIPIHKIMGVEPSEEIAYAKTITWGRWAGQFKLRRGKKYIWTDKERGKPVYKYIPTAEREEDRKEPLEAHSSTKGFSNYLLSVLEFEYANAKEARAWFIEHKNELVTPDPSGRQWGVSISGPQE